MEGSGIIWFLAVVLGTFVLGSIIAYGMARTRARTEAERQASEEKTHEIYTQQDPRY